MRPPLIDPSSRPSQLDSPRYESKFYEWQALCHVADLLKTTVLANVREFRAGARRLQLPEIDGVVEQGGRRILVETKSYRLLRADVDAIVAKYNRMRLDQLFIVAPAHEASVVVPKFVEMISFRPDLSILKQAYWGQAYKLPQPFEEELNSGGHHFRYVAACRRKGETASFRNQVDKGLKTVSQVFRDIRREERTCDLPVRVFWSVSQWLFPKELFFSSYKNHLLRRGVVFDIDGSDIHNSVSACEILPGRTTCARCFVAARGAATELLSLLVRNGFSKAHAVFSGRQGFHLYVFEEKLADAEVHELTHTILAQGIPIDANLTLQRKAVVTFPGSVHGMSMLRAIPVQDLKSLDLETILASRDTGSL